MVWVGTKGSVGKEQSQEENRWKKIAQCDMVVLMILFGGTTGRELGKSFDKLAGE